ncbi:MAG: dTMP kinase [Abditibacteriaceae bacterium]
MFITFEGIDGSGNSTQLQLLAEEFGKAGKKVLLTREPGGTALAENLRKVLLESNVSAPAELLLFGAARAQHVAEVIRPALQEGTIVLSDRFADSSAAYQGGGLQLPSTFIDAMNQFACGDLRPDLTFLLDIDPLVGNKRQQLNHQKPDIIESRGLGFLERMRQAYLQIAPRDSQRVIIINASRPPASVQCDIIAALQQRDVL